MSDVISVIREAIIGTSGLGGVLRFNATYAGGFETEEGMPDLTAITEAVHHAFPPEQAATIMAATKKKLGDVPQAPRPDAGHAQERNAAVVNVEINGSGVPEDMTFAKFFNVDPNHVRDIVSEARRLRLAMGKTIVVQPDLPAESPADTGFATSNAAAGIAVEKTTEKAVEKPVAAPDITTEDRPIALAPLKKPDARVMSKPLTTPEPVSEIDREIGQFAYGKTAYSSIDILDFIRYMKDKGYSFEECIVLEKIYVKIEDRKKEAISTIEKEVDGIFRGAQMPTEPEITGLVARLRETGLVFEEEDVRRMARIAVLRRAQESL